MAGVLQSANEAKLASMAGAYNLGITNLDDDNEPAFTGVVEVNGAYFKFTGEAPTGIGSVSGTYYISVVVNTGVTPNTATLECEATTGYTVDQTKNGIYDSTGAKRAVLRCFKSGNNYAEKVVLKSAEDYDGQRNNRYNYVSYNGTVFFAGFPTTALGDLYNLLDPIIPKDITGAILASGTLSYTGLGGTYFYYLNIKAIERPTATSIKLYMTQLQFTSASKDLTSTDTSVRDITFTSGDATVADLYNFRIILAY